MDWADSETFWSVFLDAAFNNTPECVPIPAICLIRPKYNKVNNLSNILIVLIHTKYYTLKTSKSTKPAQLQLAQSTLNKTKVKNILITFKPLRTSNCPKRSNCAF